MYDGQQQTISSLSLWCDSCLTSGSPERSNWQHLCRTIHTAICFSASSFIKVKWNKKQSSKLVWTNREKVPQCPITKVINNTEIQHFLCNLLKKAIKSRKGKKRRNLKQMPKSPSAKTSDAGTPVPCSLNRESFNYMQFALGWAISIFYVDTLPLHHAFIHFHSTKGALSRNRRSMKLCCVLYYCVCLKRK